MNKYIILIIISVFTMGAVSCKKSSSSDSKPKTVSDSTTTTATYYITYKVNNATVIDTSISATRDAVSSPRTMTISGATKAGAAVNFTFFAQEPNIGFSGGLTLQCNEVSYPNQYTEYTNPTGTLYHTKNDSDDGIDFGILSLSFTKGGVISGGFSGTITNAAGGIDHITAGTYNVKFSN